MNTPKMNNPNRRKDYDDDYIIIPYRCILCNERSHGHGNNPFPLASEGKACDSCNRDVVYWRVRMQEEMTKEGSTGAKKSDDEKVADEDEDDQEDEE